ncbi:MAG: PAS domain S-box protein [Bacteroidota bacterium]
MNSNALFEGLFKEATLGIFVVDRQGSIVNVNPLAYQLFGYQAGELIGQTIDQLVPERFRIQHMAHRAVYAHQAQPRLMGAGRDLFGVRKDGTEFSIEISLSMATLADQQYVFAFVSDISERVKTQNNLSESQSRLKAIINTAVDGIITISRRGIVESINSAAAKLFGYAAEEVIGQNVKMLMPQRDKDQHDEYLDNYHRSGERKIIGIGREVLGLKKDGTTFPFQLSVSETQLKDRTIYTGILHDLTEQKAAEEKAKMFLDLAGNIILVVNQDETIGLINREGVQILGYRDEREILGKNWFDHFIPSAERPSVRKVFYGLTHRKSAQVEHYENYIVDRHGQRLLIKWFNRLLLDDAGNPIGTISAGVDITKQRDAENKLSQYTEDLENRVAERTKELADIAKQLREALKKEQELGELKSRFVAMASHEFRTPLSSILSSAELIEQYTATEQQGKRERHVKRIASSVQNLIAVLNDFLSLEKLESNKVRYEPCLIDLNEFTEELLEEINLLTRKEQHIYVKKRSSDQMLTDPYLLKNILINLLSNAIKYSPGGESVELVFEALPSSNLIKVVDHGIGIPENDQKYLFTRFFRSSNVTNIKGTGLGLTIVKRYLNMMGGSIRFESEEGKGTTFILDIPKPKDDHEG